MSELEINIRSKADLEGAKQAESAVRNIGTAEKESGAAAKTWREFIAERMGPYMKQYGDHAGAIRQIAVEWKAYKAELASTPSLPSATSGTVISARESAQAILEAQAAAIAQSQAIAQAGKVQEAYLDKLEASTAGARDFAAAQREIERTLREAKGPVEQQGAAIGNLIGKKEGLRQIIRALTRDFPVLGRIAQFALNPLAAGIALLTVAMGKMRTGVTHVQNALLDLQDQSRRTDFVSKQQDDLNRAGRDASQYARQLRGIATAAQSITDRTNESLAATRALATAQAALDSEEHALRIEQINELERKKTITAEEGLRRRAQLEREFRALQRQHAAELEADEIKQRQ
jgi:uncharacterized protein YukE